MSDNIIIGGLIIIAIILASMLNISYNYQKEQLIDEIVKQNNQYAEELMQNQETISRLEDSLYTLRDICTPFNQTDIVTIAHAPYIMTEWDDNYHKTVYGGFSFWINHTTPYCCYIPSYLEPYNVENRTSFQVVFGSYGEHIWIKEVLQ